MRSLVYFLTQQELLMELGLADWCAVPTYTRIGQTTSLIGERAYPETPKQGAAIVKEKNCTDLRYDHK